MNTTYNIGERLKELMQDNEIKSDELAKKLNVNGSAVRKWLLYDKSIYLSTLIKIADYFKCSIDYLIGRSDIFLSFIPQETPPFIENLYIILKQKNISTYKLDKETSIHHSHLYRWRKGAEPLLDSLIILAEYLDISIDYLVGRET